MFLIDRASLSPSLRLELAPRQLFGSAGDLVRAALVAHPPLTEAAMPVAPRPFTQRDRPRHAAAQRRKAG